MHTHPLLLSDILWDHLPLPLQIVAVIVLVAVALGLLWLLIFGEV
jgi:hypothetical protein